MRPGWLVAKSMGFTVLHVYIDSLFVSKAGATRADFQAMVDEIWRETDLPMELENVHSWFAFLDSSQTPNISVANRFSGIAPDGEHKFRGIALRRRDTPVFIAHTQRGVLDILAKEADPARLTGLLPEVLEFVFKGGRS